MNTHTPPSYSTLFDSDSVFARCAALINRHYATFIRAGGGPLSVERIHKPHRQQSYSTPAQRAEVDSLLREGHLSQVEIARLTGTYPQLVCRRSKELGLTKADGRVAANKRRAQEDAL